MRRGRPRRSPRWTYEAVRGCRLEGGEAATAKENPATLKYYRTMPIDVEVNMKIPSLSVRSPGKPDQKIDNSTIRFIKRITVEAIPKPRDWLPLSTRFGEPFECTVTRADWNEEKNLFIVSCTYSRRSITADEHHALLTDSDWATKQLL